MLTETILQLSYCYALPWLLHFQKIVLGGPDSTYILKYDLNTQVQLPNLEYYFSKEFKHKMNPMKPVFRLGSSTGINLKFYFIFKPWTYFVNLEVKPEISLKLSLHKAFLLPIHFKDLELQNISKALLNSSMNFTVASEFFLITNIFRSSKPPNLL